MFHPSLALHNQTHHAKRYTNTEALYRWGPAFITRALAASKWAIGPPVGYEPVTLPVGICPEKKKRFSLPKKKNNKREKKEKEEEEESQPVARGR